MSKTITLNYEGKAYTLEFTRATAKMFEDMGYTPADIFTRPNSCVIPFIWCAFKANHAQIKQSLVEKIYGAVPSSTKQDLLTAIIRMYTDTYNSLLGSDKADNEGDEGNVTWEQNWSDDSE